MSQPRRAKKIDANQPAIVKSLGKIPNLSIELDHDDLLIGYNRRTYWFELKDPDKLFNKDGTVAKGAVKDGQYKLIENFKGHYKIVWTLDQILTEIGIKKMTKKIQKELRELLQSGYTIGQPTGVLYHTFTPDAKPIGIHSEHDEAVEAAYKYMKGEQ